MEASTDMRDRLMDVSEVARYLNVRTSWIYSKAAQRAIPCSRVGKYLRFRKAEIDEWLESEDAF